MRRLHKLKYFIYSSVHFVNSQKAMSDRHHLLRLAPSQVILNTPVLLRPVRYMVYTSTVIPSFFSQLQRVTCKHAHKHECTMMRLFKIYIFYFGPQLMKSIRK